MYPVGPGHSKHLFDLFSGVACLADPRATQGGHELPGGPHGDLMELREPGQVRGNASVDDGAPAIVRVP